MNAEEYDSLNIEVCKTTTQPEIPIGYNLPFHRKGLPILIHLILGLYSAISFTIWINSSEINNIWTLAQKEGCESVQNHLFWTSVFQLLFILTNFMGVLDPFHSSIPKAQIIIGILGLWIVLNYEFSSNTNHPCTKEGLEFKGRIFVYILCCTFQYILRSKGEKIKTLFAQIL